MYKLGRWSVMVDMPMFYAHYLCWVKSEINLCIVEFAIGGVVDMMTLATTCIKLYLSFECPFSQGIEYKLQGTVYSVSMDSHTGSLSRSHRHRTNHKSPVTTVKYRSFSLLASGPVLLTCTQDGNLCFFRLGNTTFFLSFLICSLFSL